MAVVTVGAMFYSFAFSIYCFVFHCSTIQSTLDEDEGVDFGISVRINWWFHSVKDLHTRFWVRSNRRNRFLEI